MTAPAAFSAPLIFTGEDMLEGHHLVVRGGRVEAVLPGAPDAVLAHTRFESGVLAPGFVDAQVNGGGGVMLNDDPSPATMARIAAAHRAFGATALLPTLITDTPEKTRAALDAAAEATGSPGIAGLHLEGPHLDPAKKGAHPAALMRPLTDDDIALYAAARRKIGVLLVTLAASQATPDQVRRLAGEGVTVSIGHSDCTAAEADALFDAGARGATHLFNAMSGLSHREPGLVGAVLSRGDVWGGVIADGHHVDPRALNIAFAAKRGPGRLFLVTDAMALVGSERDSFLLHGRTVRRDPAGFCPKLTLEDGTLAGSDIDMASSVRFCVEALGLPLEDALRRASADPATFLGLDRDHGFLRPGARADLVHLDGALRVTRTFIAGEP